MVSQSYISYEEKIEGVLEQEKKQKEATQKVERFMPRGKILDLAKETINGKRVDQYGKPENNFHIIGQYIRIYLKGRGYGDIVLEEQDVAMLQALLKLGRITTGTAKEDSFVDLLGYVALAYDMSKVKVA